MTSVVVHHFGPAIGSVGGMASVLELMERHQIGADRVLVHPTWVPEPRWRSATLTALAAARVLRVPRTAIVHVHLSEGGSFAREGLVLLLARRRGLSTAVTLHGADFESYAAARPRVVRTVLRSSDLIVALSDGAASAASRAAPDARIVRVPNPISIDDASPPADETAPLVLFAGEIGTRKGADVLARAWPLIARGRPDARALLVGPRADVHVPDSPTLRVHSPVSTGRVRELLHDARVVVLPSRAEAMPMVLLEALAARRPFVATPVGGIPSIADAGGTLIPVGDEHALAAAVGRYLDDAGYARSRGEAGQAECRASRSVPVVDHRLRSAYLDILDDRRRSPSRGSGGPRPRRRRSSRSSPHGA